MEYKFKQIKLSKAERLWLTEILKSNFSNVIVKSLRVKLWDKLPKDFDPKTIDNRLIRNNHLTLIGLWHVDPENAIFNHVSKIIEITKGLIFKNPEISGIKANEIAKLAGITERDAEIALKFLYDLGGFFGSASLSNTHYGALEAGFRQDDLPYNEFLRFENLEQKMEQFFIGRRPSSNIKNKKLFETRFLKNSGDFRMQQSTQNIWNDIRNNFGISKQTFGKKWNFVTDKYKRKIIFRDIEHAYILANQRFSKPATILAGSVIEELLRLYLESKNIKPTKNTFEGYITICEQKKLLKSGIFRLSDSVRHFRNIVHLSGETEKYTISKATAKGAVASIFTIVNDF